MAGKSKRRAFPPQDNSAGVAEDDAGYLLVKNVDGMTEDEKDAWCAEAAKATEIPVFKGHVEHAYDADFVTDHDHCPRCGGGVQTMYSNFVYATQIAPRSMFIPAGRFCTQCPSVLIDQELISQGVADPRFKFQGVLGVEYGGTKEADYFRTWNGKAAVYIFDEDECPMGITTEDQIPATRYTSQAPDYPAKTKRKNKNREKAARRARRRKGK